MNIDEIVNTHTDLKPPPRSKVRLLDYKTENPRLDLSGKWRRTESTLCDLEGLRESRGVPWILRKLIKQMESTFEIRQTPKRLEVMNKRKLASSGYHFYELDGVQHEYEFAAPLPGATPIMKHYCCWVDTDLQRVVLIYTYTDDLRLVRTVIRSEDGESLNSEVVLQKLVINKWTNQAFVNAKAVRLTDDEFFL